MIPVVLPILIPLLTAGACLLLEQRGRLQRIPAMAGAVGLLAAAVYLFTRVWLEGIQVLHVGGWRAPLGITLVADHLSALMVLIASILHLAISVYSLANVNIRQRRYGYFVFLNVMLMGVCGAFLTGDLFNLYVWFEVMLMSSFVLLVLGGRENQMVAGIKYVTLSLLSSALFLAAVGIIYGIAHTLNMADLSQRLAIASQRQPGLVTAASLLLMLAFGIKAAVFPLHFWLPDSYHTPAPAVTAIFAALLTKTGIYAIIRVFGQVLPPSDYLYTILGVVAGSTMLIGVLGAVSQGHIRKILNVHIVSQIGYMVMGVALLNAADQDIRRLALAAAIFFVVHNMLVKTNLILVSGTIRTLNGTEQLGRLGGFAKRAPVLATVFLLSALSLAGLPPTSGFWGKLGLIRAGFEAEAYVLTATALFVGLLTLLSMLKIWSEVFWKPLPESEMSDKNNHISRTQRTILYAPNIALAVLFTIVGLYPQPLLATARRAADELLDRPGYVAAMGRPSEPPDHATTRPEGEP